MKILDILTKLKKIPLRELAAKLNCSEITVRRDLKDSEVEKLIYLKSSIVYLKEHELNPLFTYSSDVNLAEKQRIAKYVVSLLEPGNVIALDIGSTNFEIAKELLKFTGHLTIFTTSIECAYILSNNEQFEVYIVPGRVRKNRYVSVGNLASDFITMFNYDYYFLGAAGIEGNHIYDYIIEEAHIKKKFIAQSEQTFVVVDHSKFGNKSLVKVVSLNQVKQIVTDYLPDKYVKELQHKTTILRED